MKIKRSHKDWKSNKASIQNNSKSYTSNSIFKKYNYRKKITLKILSDHLNNIDEIKKLSKAGIYYLLTKVLNFSDKRARPMPK